MDEDKQYAAVDYGHTAVEDAGENPVVDDYESLLQWRKVARILQWRMENYTTEDSPLSAESAFSSVNPTPAGPENLKTSSCHVGISNLAETDLDSQVDTSYTSELEIGLNDTFDSSEDRSLTNSLDADWSDSMDANPTNPMDVDPTTDSTNPKDDNPTNTVDVDPTTDSTNPMDANPTNTVDVDPTTDSTNPKDDNPTNPMNTTTQDIEHHKELVGKRKASSVETREDWREAKVLRRNQDDSLSSASWLHVKEECEEECHDWETRRQTVVDRNSRLAQTEKTFFSIWNQFLQREVILVPPNVFPVSSSVQFLLRQSNILQFLPTPLAVAWVFRLTFSSPPPLPPPSSHLQPFLFLLGTENAVDLRC